MAISVCEVSITHAPLKVPTRSGNEAAGAVVDFLGVVRRIEDGREISGIDYEAHSGMAEHQMRKLAETAVRKFGLTNVAICHRIGFVAAMEPSIVVHIESAHRGAAFNASQWIMDELKETVPIWKHPVFTQRNEVDPATKEADEILPQGSTSLSSNP